MSSNSPAVERLARVWFNVRKQRERAEGSTDPTTWADLTVTEQQEWLSMAADVSVSMRQEAELEVLQVGVSTSAGAGSAPSEPSAPTRMRGKCQP